MDLRQWTIALLLTGIMLATGIAQATGGDAGDNDPGLSSEIGESVDLDAEFVIYMVDGEAFAVPVAEGGGAPGSGHTVPVSCHDGVGCEGFPFFVDESGDTMTGPLVMEADLVISDNGGGNRLLLEEGAEGEVQDGGRFLFRTGSELSFENGVVFDFPEEMGAIFQGISEIGNTDGDNFAVLVGNHTGLRLQAVDDSLGHTGNVTPAVIGGHPDNQVTAGVAGATIGGGGNTSEGNQVLGDYGTVGGGLGNIAGNASEGSGEGVGTAHHRTWNYGTVGGGYHNYAGGAYSTVGGGNSNRATDDFASVVGGVGNRAFGFGSTTTGGSANHAHEPFSTISGGRANKAEQAYSTIGGGERNAAAQNYATVSGGLENTADRFYSVVGGGINNLAEGEASVVAGGNSNEAKGSWSDIGGGANNLAKGFASTVAGGKSNDAIEEYSAIGGGEGNKANGHHSIVSGGKGNEANREYAVVAGGVANEAANDHSTVSGGNVNRAMGRYTTISGGSSNTASGNNSVISGGSSHTTKGEYGAVSGGRSNHAEGDLSTVSGGSYNRASGLGSSVPGGFFNTAEGAGSLAAGWKSVAAHDHSFVWSSDPFQYFTSSGENQFLIDAAGGVGIGTNTSSGLLTVAGNVTPSETSMHALGTPKDRWMQLFVSGGIDHEGPLVFQTQGDETLRLTETGSIVMPGTVTAEGFIGDGSGLTGLNFELEDGQVTVEKLADGAVSLAKLSASECPHNQILRMESSSGDPGWHCADTLDDQIVQNQHIEDGAVSLAKLTSAECLDNEIIRMDSSSADPGWRCVQTLEDQTVQNQHIGDGAVSLAKLSASECPHNKILRMESSLGDPGWHCADTLDDQIVQNQHIEDGAVSLAKLTSAECLDNEIIRMDSSSADPGWRCVQTLEDQTVQNQHIGDGAVTAAKLGQVCADGETLVYDGISGAWGCGTVGGEGTLAQLDCLEGQVVKFDPGEETWVCAEDLDEDTQYAAGEGLQLASGEFALATCADSQVLKATATGWACAVDESGETTSLPWSSITEIPPGFADDVDDVGITEETDPTVNDLAKAPLACSEGLTVKYDGATWSCAQDLDEDTLSDLSCSHMEIARWTNDGLWFCSQDEDTTYSAGDALTLTGTEFALASCPESQVLKATATGWACAVDESGETTSLPWSSITEIPPGFADDVDDVGITEETDPTVNDLAKAPLACSEGLTVKYDGASWFCAEDLDEDTTYSAGEALTLDGTEFSLEACPAGMMYKHDGGFWVCSEDRDRLTEIGCEEHQIAKVFFGIPPDGGETFPQNYWGCAEDNSLEELSCTSGAITRFDGSQWTCSQDQNTLYNAGDGLELEADDTFHVMSCPDTGILKSDGGGWICQQDQDLMQDLNCGVDQVPKMAHDDDWTCGMDLHTEYTAGEGLELDNQEFSLTNCSGDQILKFDSFSWFCSEDDDTLRDLACSEGQVTKVAADDSWQCSDIVTDPVWALGGNTGTDPDLDYLGTNDQTPLQVRVDGQKVATFEVEGTVRMGSDTVGEPAVHGTITRQVASRATTAGDDVAVTDKLAFERDGTNGGFQIRTIQNIPSSTPQNIACQGITETGDNANAYVTIPGGTASGTVFQVYENADNVHRLDCSFGNPFGGAGEHYTSLELMRASGDFWWMGMVTSTTNQ